ncbi:MGT family glycosyltransferase [Xylariaceae sp. FL0804]|nr:MGT family glycosyltransferase [Xylariaceae sp. FL0804]
MSAPTNQPLVLICSTPVSGHIIPMQTIAKSLIDRGYNVYFVSSSGYRQQIEAIGASFVPVRGYGDFYDLRARDLDPDWPTPLLSLDGPEHFCHDLVHIFCKSVPSQLEALQRALRWLSEKHPHSPVIVLTESLNFGALPLKLGAPGTRPKGLIAIGLNPVFLSSLDHRPFGPGLLPDSSPGSRQRNQAANERQKQVFAAAQTALGEALVSVGATETLDDFLLDALYSLPDRFIQLCPPCVEYPRSDAPDTLRFAGGYPEAPRELRCWKRPAWWDEVTDSGRTRRIVFVCQGTVAADLNQLVYPTMTALGTREDLLVVVALGQKGLALPAGFAAPPNCRVADFIPYDDVLPNAEVFVTTGGYGGFQRALKHGVPLVMGATTEEKPETCARAEWAGVAVNLRTSNPSVEQLRCAVDDILGDARYKTRALEIQADIATHDPMAVIVDNIEELAGK